MTTITTTIDLPGANFAIDPAELAAISFLARYNGRTLDAYRHDLRNLFQWAADHGLPVLDATRAHLEFYRSSMEERGLAASTIDRRLSTACGFYRFAHIDGGSRPTPLSMFAARQSTHPSGADSTVASPAASSSPPSASTTPTRPWQCCSG
ncbi:MAG: site-specific integrase [Acidimicrobiaceae bacterium]|nr:site-specific integrase [Acidimicrobiaceae bacterium]